MAPKIFLCSHRYMIYDAVLSILAAAFKSHVKIGEPTYVVTSFKRVKEFHGLIKAFTNVSMIMTERGNTKCSQQILGLLERGEEDTNRNRNTNIFIYYDFNKIKPGLLHILKRCQSKDVEVYCVNMRIQRIGGFLWGPLWNIDEVNIQRWHTDFDSLTDTEFEDELKDRLYPESE